MTITETNFFHSQRNWTLTNTPLDPPRACGDLWKSSLTIWALCMHPYVCVRACVVKIQKSLHTRFWCLGSVIFFNQSLFYGFVKFIGDENIAVILDEASIVNGTYFSVTCSQLFSTIFTHEHMMRATFCHFWTRATWCPSARILPGWVVTLCPNVLTSSPLHCETRDLSLRFRLANL